MKIKTRRIYGILLSLPLLCGPALAQEACWQAPELKAYNVTMQILMTAHVASVCDGMVKADTPLRAQFAAFLGKNGAEMQSDRDALGDYYQRAYGADWQGPMQKSLDREAKRLAAQVSDAESADTCEDAQKLIEGLGDASWADFVAQAEAQHWDQRAGFPACETSDSPHD